MCKRQRIALQLAAAALDYRLDPTQCSLREHETRRLNLVAQDREVVIIPEAAGKRVGPALESFHAAGSYGFEKLQLVPQILRLFAALYTGQTDHAAARYVQKRLPVFVRHLPSLY